MKRIFATLLTLVLVLSAFSFAVAEDTVNITVFHYMAQATKQAGLVAIEEAYSALHPEVTFTNIYYNQGTDYFPQLSHGAIVRRSAQYHDGQPRPVS